MRAIFRTDASLAIGGGHVVRSLALAHALADVGCRSGFVCAEDSASVVPSLAGGEVDLYAIPPERLDDAGLLGRIAGDDCDLLIVDHYGLNSEFEKNCREFAKTIVAIDDLARDHAVDFVIDQTAGRNPDDYKDHVPASCRVLAGSQFAMLRPEFSRLRQASLNRRQSNEVKRAFVSIGTLDRYDLTGTIIDAFDGIDPQVEIDVVIGSTSPNLPQLRNQSKSLKRRVSIHTDVDANAIARLIGQADIAIGAGGTSSWERCCLGLPTVMITIADNQELVAKHLSDLGAVDYLGFWTDVPVERISIAIGSLIADHHRRIEMSKRAASACDGRGAFRVARALVPMRSKDGAPVEVRPVTMSDSKQLLEWRSHPAVCKYSRNTNAPSQAEHENFLTKKLSDPNCVFNILTYGGKPAGMVRLDLMDASHVERSPSSSGRITTAAYEVSVLVDPDKHGLGLGQCALNLASELVPDAVLFAQIHPENIPSQKLFRKVGYVPDGEWFVRPAFGVTKKHSSEEISSLP
jgi:UDP-2,4-diacetamido-2,4,6-trideoxy-beta-L-altropyranose hydrolase